MEEPSNTANKRKAMDTSGNTQALQVVTGISLLPPLVDLLLPRWCKRHLP
ncbi:UNVERIFIED_CONTAM: hypothetical protein Sangu_2623500 [Sesamum angustifolium]|uniref:Uncharacterized protein n=1 Tax=Sesamum angustifolium TaxID=2727405 RepID=A0AAW2J6S2_9LAMI